MGESSSGSDSSMSNQQLNKAKKNREVKEQEQSRNKAFDTYKKYPGDMLQTDKRVLDNIKIATDLENKSRTSQINIPIPTVGSVVMNTISSANYKNQAKQLRGGGNAVYGDKGEYQGVVHGGTFGGKVYSGNADYSPIGRSQGASFNSATGTYTSSKMESSGNDGNDSQASNNTPSKTQTTAIDKTDSTTTSLSTASRRSLLSGGGAGAARRNLI
tara:strand:- start:44 stop:688 length:645 start_codon:yes stop_codon:yes gene_type:complete